MDKNTILKLKTDNNPYEVNSSEWHCFVDMQCSTGVLVKDKQTICLGVALKEHGMTLEYYSNYLAVLIEDGVLELVQFHNLK